MDVVGCFEQVTFPEFGSSQFWAKVDTGAYSGALHCTRIKVVIRDGVRVLKFKPVESHREIETTEFKSIFVRSATGHRIRRHVIATTIIVGDKRYPIVIGLSNRSDMKKPVLLGRRFLREQGIVVDVRINQEEDYESRNIT